MGKGQALTEDFADGHIEAVRIIQRIVFGRTVVIAEYLFVKVTKQMEWFDTNVASGDAALQQTPEVFQPVGVNLPVNVFLGVVNDFVGVFLSQPIVGLQCIRVESRTSFDMLFDGSLQCGLLSVCDYHGANLAAALQCSEHDGFVFAASTSDAPLPFVQVHIASLPADEGFVNLDFTVQLAAESFILQSQTNPMQYEPCGFLSHIQIAGQFATADAVLAIGEQPESSHPLVKADSGILANASDFDGELALRVNLRAFPSPPLGVIADFFKATTGTDHAIRPTADGEIINAVVRIREVNDCFLEALWFAHKSLTYKQNLTLKPLASQVNNCPNLRCLMISEGSQTLRFSSELPTDLRLDDVTCPSCGQEIPPDKFEEISGKIAAREREQTLAITSQLETRYATEKAQAEAKAKSELEAARQHSAARETRIREEAQNAAESLISEKVAEAKRVAESALAERIAEIDATHKKSESAFQIRINEAEADRVAAEQKERVLTLRIDDLQSAHETEVAKVKEKATTEATRIRQTATEAAEIRARDTIAAHEKAVAEANAKTREAERHASEIEDRLTTQREVLEKAKEDAVNVQQAKAFQENQKLSNKVSELQRALEKKTADELGEGAEIDLFEALKAEFRGDNVERIAKGAPGADICHVVMLGNKECGTILYDSKNRKRFEAEYVTKLRGDQLAAKAEHAILSTNKFPKGGPQQIHTQDGVVLANPARVVSIATILRQHVIQVHTLRLSNFERDRKTAALYEFITSQQCTQLLDRINERASDLIKRQEKEITWHQTNWSKQGEAIRAIQKAKVDLDDEISRIIGASDESASCEAS